MRRALFLAAAIALLSGVASLAGAETIQRGPARVSFDGKIVPSRLPRQRLAPVRVAVETAIGAARPGRPLPRLTRIELAINAHGRLDSTGLPACEVKEIQPATTAKALQACRGALVGSGHFSASVALSSQAPFPSRGRLLAFNGSYREHPAILAHVYGTEPIPTSFTLPFAISRRRGTFGTVLTASLPRSGDSLVTGLDMTLGRSFSYRGGSHSFASASCPAPAGFPGAVFPFARATYEFAGGIRLASTLTRSCRVR